MSARDELARALMRHRFKPKGHADCTCGWAADPNMPVHFEAHLADAVLAEWLPTLADPIAVALWRSWGFDLIDPEETDPVDREHVTGEIRDALAAAVLP